MSANILASLNLLYFVISQRHDIFARDEWETTLHEDDTSCPEQSIEASG